MNKQVENFAEQDMSGIIYNETNPSSDVPEQYREEPANLYGEDPRLPYNEESGNPYDEEQVNKYNEDVGDQYNEEHANPSQENLANSYNGEAEQQGNVETDEKKWPGWPGESVFRILVPVQKVGAIIGRKGEFIKRMCEESKSRIKILDAPPGIPERAVLTAA